MIARATSAPLARTPEYQRAGTLGQVAFSRLGDGRVLFMETSRGMEAIRGVEAVGSAIVVELYSREDAARAHAGVPVYSRGDQEDSPARTRVRNRLQRYFRERAAR